MIIKNSVCQRPITLDNIAGMPPNRKLIIQYVTIPAYIVAIGGMGAGGWGYQNADMYDI